MSGPTGWQDAVRIEGLTEAQLRQAIANGDVIYIHVTSGLIAGQHRVKPSPVTLAGYTPHPGAITCVIEFQDATTNRSLDLRYPHGAFCVVDLVTTGPFRGWFQGGINPVP